MTLCVVAPAPRTGAVKGPTIGCSRAPIGKIFYCFPPGEPASPRQSGHHQPRAGIRGALESIDGLGLRRSVQVRFVPSSKG